MLHNSEKVTKIRGCGLQIFIVTTITSLLVLFGVTSAIWALIANTKEKYVYLALGAFMAIVGIYEFYKLVINSSKITFIKNSMVVKSKNMYLDSVDINCAGIINCEILKHKYPVNIKLSADNKFEFYLSEIVFTKKQIKQILIEIQIRGGLQGIDLTKIL